MPYTDILVIGSGIAGLSAALQAARRCRVALLCKGEATSTNTSLAQGGLAAVLLPEDTPARHQADTLVAGSGCNDRRAVALLVREAPACIEELLRLGVPFDRQSDGSLSLGLEGGHSHRRIVHVRDQTGWQVQQQLLQAVRAEPNIQLLEHQLVVDLLLEGGAGSPCLGAKVLDLKQGVLRDFYAKATILATGGGGQLYQHTTNPKQATADGLAVAARAGAALADLEFVQFHPTALYDPGKPVFLISEALRGFGAELVLPGGERFMPRHHPQGSLAPRDVVSQAMHREMQQRALPCLHLDLRQLPQEGLASQFPTIYQTLRQRGFDPAHALIPVVPAAHYLCGGIKTNLHGKTNLPRLYACGECACTGLHGANRLASNSLPEGWLMGRRAAIHAHSLLGEPFSEKCRKSPDEQLPGQQEGSLALLLRQQLQACMWQYVGVVRSRRGLQKCLRLLAQLQAEVATLPREEMLNESWLELKNLVEVAQLLTRAALNRKESCGCHCMQEEEEEDMINEPGETFLRQR